MMYILTQNRKILNFDSYSCSDIYRQRVELDNGKSFNYVILMTYFNGGGEYCEFRVAKYSSQKICNKIFKDFWNALKNGEKYFEFPTVDPEGEE